MSPQPQPREFTVVVPIAGCEPGDVVSTDDMPEINFDALVASGHVTEAGAQPIDANGDETDDSMSESSEP